MTDYKCNGKDTCAGFGSKDIIIAGQAWARHNPSRLDDPGVIMLYNSVLLAARKAIIDNVAIQ